MDERSIEHLQCAKPSLLTVMPPSWAAVSSFLALVGIGCDERLWREVADVAAVPPHSLQTVLERPADLVHTWHAHLNNRHHEKWGPKVQTALYSVLTLGFYSLNDGELAVELQKIGFKLAATRAEAAFRFASSLLMFGRDLLGEHPNLRLEARRSLSESIVCWNLQNWVILEWEKNRGRKRTALGMRGVAYLLLSRGMRNEGPYVMYLTAAKQDLETSITLGNITAESLEYAAEISVRLAYEAGDTAEKHAHLDCADRFIIEALNLGYSSSGLIFTHGDILLQRGMLLTDAGSYSEALPFLIKAEKKFTEAMELLASANELNTPAICGKRGQARFRIFTATNETAAGEDLDLLNLAIADLEVAHAAKVPVGGGLPFALLFRARRNRRSHEYGLAISDLMRAQTLADEKNSIPELQLLPLRIEAELSATIIWQAKHTGQFEQTLLACMSLLALPAAVSPSEAAMAEACRQLSMRDGTEAHASLILKVVDYLEQQLNAEQVGPREIAFRASNAGSLLMMMKDTLDDAALSRALRLLETAISNQEEPVPELLGNVAEAHRMLGRVAAEKGDDDLAEHHYLMSCDFGTKTITQANAMNWQVAIGEVNVASKLGESYAKLHALTRESKYGNQAIMYFRRSISLGNESPDILGLLGDVYYRLATATDSPEEYREALSLKDRAWEKGHRSVENRSLVARIHIDLARLESEPHAAALHLIAAVTSSMQAHAINPQWPWPVFQLADIAEEVARRGVAAEVHQVFGSSADELLQVVSAGGIANLYMIAAKLAVANRDEYARLELGGRSKVYTLDDSHALLSASIVIKPTTLVASRDETRKIASFRDFLKDRNATSSIELPEPLAIVREESTQNVHFVMRRATGWSLGKHVTRNKYHPERIYPLFITAVEALAHYHAWGACRTELSMKHEAERRMATKLSEALTSIGVMYSEAQKFGARLLSLPSRNSALVYKKDAHAENWLATPHGKIVVLDLEASSFLPVYCELAQLVESYPAFDQSEKAWQLRYKLLENYSTILDRLLPHVALGFEEAIHSYELFALYWAAAGLRFAVRDATGMGYRHTSSEIRAGYARLPHYLDLIVSLGVRATTEDTKQCAWALSLLLQAPEVQARVKTLDRT